MFEIYPLAITVETRKREKGRPFLQSIGKNRDIRAISDFVKMMIKLIYVVLIK